MSVFMILTAALNMRIHDLDYRHECGIHDYGFSHECCFAMLLGVIPSVCVFMKLLLSVHPVIYRDILRIIQSVRIRSQGCTAVGGGNTSPVTKLYEFYHLLPTVRS